MSTSNSMQQGPTVCFNVLKNQNNILVKQIEILSDGSLKKNHGGQIPKGSTITTEVKPLLQYIQGAYSGGIQQYILPSNAALGLNTPITPKDLIVEGGVDRTAKTLVYCDGPATLTFDHDPSEYSKMKVVNPDAFVDILAKHFPIAFGKAAWGSYDSSGSFIYSYEGKEITGRRGFHVVFSVENATEIMELGTRLFKRLWLLGYGYIHVSKDGKALHRTIFDTKVIEPQQPLFSGGAHCIGCEQHRPEPAWHDGKYVDTTGVPELTADENQEYQRLVEMAKREAQPTCERIRRDYTIYSVAKLVDKTAMSAIQAKKVVESRLAGTLVGSDTLMFDSHGEVAVSTILANPAKFNECTLADPIDGDVAGKAILYINAVSGVPIIYSHAHGGGCFFLKHNLESLLNCIDNISKEQTQDEWSELLSFADLRPDEADRFLQAVKSKTGIGMGSLRQTVKNIQRQEIDNKNQDLTQDPGLFIANLLLDQQYKNGTTLIKLESGSFWYYTATHWTQITESVVGSQLQELATIHWNRIRTMWEASSKKSSTMSSLVNGALSCLGGLVVVEGDPLRLNSTRPSVINCSNGELWLEASGPELRPHRPESYLTSCSAIKFDPAATAPTYEVAMRGILSFPGGRPMPDQTEMLRHFDELLGYTIQTRRNLKIFILVVGPGDNGKTRIVKLLSLILGNDAIASDRLAGVDERGNRFATSRLVGKIVIVDDDIDKDYVLPDGFLKKIAEQKPLTAEAKFKDSYSFIAQVVPWILGNYWPKTRDLSRGMQTRANVLYLPRSFLKPSECDKNSPDRQRPELWDRIYAEEMPGVLNRLIAAYYRVASRNDFIPPVSARQAFDSWLSDANVVSRFIKEACERIPSNKSSCTTTMIFDAFTKWCDNTGVEQIHRPQRNQFKRRLIEIGICVKHTDVGTGIYGVKIK